MKTTYEASDIILAEENIAKMDRGYQLVRSQIIASIESMKAGTSVEDVITNLKKTLDGKTLEELEAAATDVAFLESAAGMYGHALMVFHVMAKIASLRSKEATDASQH